LSFGDRLKQLRTYLDLSQEDFARLLAISQKHISQLEKENKKPSEQLIKLISLRLNTPEVWLKTGEGEMFISPEESLKNIMARLGERTFLDAISNIMKEHGLAMAAIRPSHHAETGDPDLDRILNTIYDLLATNDNDIKGWLKIQLHRAIPDDIIEDVQKKQKETHGEPQVS